MGLRYFNVFGPYEFHKKKMASVMLHFYLQLKKNNLVQVFKGDENIKNGEHSRDFISVEECINVNLFFFNQCKKSGIFNVGTGCSNTYNKIAKLLIENFEKGKSAILIFQNFTRQVSKSYKADISSLQSLGYQFKFNIDESIRNYFLWLQENY